MKVKEAIEFLSKKNPEDRISKLYYCTEEEEWGWGSFSFDYDNFIFDELYCNYTAKEMEELEDDGICHLACRNWPYCDEYGCGD